MRKSIYLILIAVCIAFNSNAQFGKLLKSKKESTEQTSDTTKKSTDGDESSGSKKKASSGFFGKVMGKAAMVAGKAVGGMTGMTAVGNLEVADVIASMGTNIYPKDLGLMFNEIIGKNWVDHGDFGMLQIASKDGFKFYKYDGTIKFDNTEMAHVAMGIFSAVHAPTTGNKKITFEKNGVVEGSFEIPQPAQNIKLVSVNGQTKDAKVDFTKDIVLELSNYSTQPNALIRVDIIVTMVGLRTLSLLAYVKPAAKVTIPPAAFRNLENEGNFKLKDCYLSISDQSKVKAINPTGKIPADQMVITGSNDGMWIEVLGSGDVSKGIKDIPNLEKRNAAYAMPLSFAKKIAVGCMYAEGEITYHTESVKTSEKRTFDIDVHATYTKTTTTTTTTKTKESKDAQFPQIPDAIIDESLASLYTKLSAVFSEVNGSTVLPPSTIPNTPSYEKSLKFMSKEENTKTEFSRSYQNLKSIGNFSTVNNMYYGVEALINDAKADALLKVTLRSKLFPNGNKSVMRAYMEVELLGPANGSFRSFMGNTKYFTMHFSGTDYELKKKQTVDFSKVFQVDNFVSQFKEKLTQLKAKEDAIKDYDVYWNLQR